MTDPVTTARLVRLLQLQLEARGRKRSGETHNDRQARFAPNELRDLVRRAGRNEQSRDDLRRAVIEHLLADRLGARLRTEPKFQQVLDHVQQIIADQKEWVVLLDRTIEDLLAD